MYNYSLLSRVLCSLVSTHLVKVGNDLIEQPEALFPSLVDISLIVELPEAGDGGKHDTHMLVRLRIQHLYGTHNYYTAFYGDDPIPVKTLLL